MSTVQENMIIGLKRGRRTYELLKTKLNTLPLRTSSVKVARNMHPRLDRTSTHPALSPTKI